MAFTVVCCVKTKIKKSVNYELLVSENDYNKKRNIKPLRKEIARTGQISQEKKEKD